MDWQRRHDRCGFRRGKGYAGEGELFYARMDRFYSFVSRTAAVVRMRFSMALGGRIFSTSV